MSLDALPSRMVRTPVHWSSPTPSWPPQPAPRCPSAGSSKPPLADFSLLADSTGWLPDGACTCTRRLVCCMPISGRRWTSMKCSFV